MDNDLLMLVREKYAGDKSLVTDEDKKRLGSSEPLAYIIGWIPFLGLRIQLGSHPLIPRPETEWWTEKLISHLQERFGSSPFTFLDLCAGSGAIGLSILKAFPAAQVTFMELVPEHCKQIKENVRANSLDASRSEIICADLFGESAATWDVIATNPPYIPDTRTLDSSVTSHEPREALFSGSDGLELIRCIATDAPKHLNKKGEIWLEADTSNIETAEELLAPSKPKQSAILTDQYDRPRIVVAYY